MSEVKKTDIPLEGMYVRAMDEKKRLILSGPGHFDFVGKPPPIREFFDDPAPGTLSGHGEHANRR